MANLSDKFSTYGLSLATAQVEYLLNTNSSTSETNGANTTSTFAYGDFGQAILAYSNSGNWVVKRVQAVVAFSKQDRIDIEVSKDGNEWFEASVMFPSMESGSFKYGIDYEPVDGSNTQIDVRFGGNGANGTEAWSAYTSWFWRVRVTRANLSAGYAAANTTAAGLVDTSQQSFAGLKKFEGGESSVEYVGSNPEVGGSSPFQLTSAHKRIQVLNTASAITVRLPSAGIKAGEVVEIHNRNVGIISVTSSSPAAIDDFSMGFIRCIALIDSPATASDWHVLEIDDRAETSTTSGITPAGGGSLGGGTTITYAIRRFGSGPVTTSGSRTISVWVRLNGTCTGTVNEVGFGLASRLCVSSSSFRTGAFCTPETNGLGRVALEESGLNFRIFNATGTPQNFPASFDFKHAITVTRY